MADWTTISALATAGGTLVLAVATFSAVRSSNRSARTTERMLLANIRPVLMPARPQDPPQKITFGDDHWMKVEGGRAGVDVADEVIYLGIPVRNVGTGLAVLDRWDVYAERVSGATVGYHDPADFRRLTRDLYVPAGDVYFWQGALRDPTDPLFVATRDAIDAREALTIDLLYGDHEGGQRTITRFGILPAGDDNWMAVVGRHWNLDRDDPR